MPLPLFIADLPETLLRFLPRPTRPGLQAVGAPGPDSPVLLTGNFGLTVRRLRRALRGQDVWLVVADSRGINVWCAACGGHMTHDDVITALQDVDDRVRTRRVVLPPMLAPGAEQRLVEHATGWKLRWGPMHLEDLPAWLDTQGPIPEALRRVRFPTRDRVDMALAWAFPITLAAAALAAWLLDPILGLALAIALPAITIATFLGIPRLPFTGPARWLTGLVGAVGATTIGAAVLALGGGLTPALLGWLAGINALAMLTVAGDAAGTTPIVPGSLDKLHKQARLALRVDRCHGCGLCARLCPTGVFELRAGAIAVQRPEACLACAACAIQCPHDALWFEGIDESTSWEPTRLRASRTNLLGKRVPLP
jgi:ferredoxin